MFACTDFRVHCSNKRAATCVLAFQRGLHFRSLGVSRQKSYPAYPAARQQTAAHGSHIDFDVNSLGSNIARQYWSVSPSLSLPCPCVSRMLKCLRRFGCFSLAGSVLDSAASHSMHFRFSAGGVPALVMDENSAPKSEGYTLLYLGPQAVSQSVNLTQC